MAREGLRRRPPVSYCEKAGPARKKARAITKKTPASPSNVKNPCPICLEELESMRHLVLLPCEHHFHRTCAIDWLESLDSVRNHSCPTCRTSVVKISTNGLIEDNRVLAFGGRKPTRARVLVLMRHLDERVEEQGINGKDEWLAHLKEANENEINVVRGHRADAVKKRKHAAWLDDIDKELEKLDQRTRAYNEINFVDGRSEPDSDEDLLIDLTDSDETSETLSIHAEPEEANVNVPIDFANFRESLRNDEELERRTKECFARYWPLKEQYTTAMANRSAGDEDCIEELRVSMEYEVNEIVRLTEARRDIIGASRQAREQILLNLNQQRPVRSQLAGLDVPLAADPPAEGSGTAAAAP